MYNYYEAVFEDLKDYMYDNYTPQQLAEMTEDDIADEAFGTDEVTGNVNGYDYPEVVKTYLMDNLPLALECVYECGGYITDLVQRGEDIYTYLDTTIRCSLVYEAAARFVAELGGDDENYSPEEEQI